MAIRDQRGQPEDRLVRLVQPVQQQIPEPQDHSAHPVQPEPQDQLALLVQQQILAQLDQLDQQGILDQLVMRLIPVQLDLLDGQGIPDQLAQLVPIASYRGQPDILVQLAAQPIPVLLDQGG